MTNEESRELREIQGRQVEMVSALKGIAGLAPLSDEAATLLTWAVAKMDQICDDTDHFLMQHRPGQEQHRSGQEAFKIESGLSELSGALEGMYGIVQNATDLVSMQDQLTPLLKMSIETLGKYVEDVVKMEA